MITSIRPTAREAYDQAYKWEKDEENRFAASLARAKPRYPSMPELPMASNTSFDNPAFNIIAGETNYTLLNLASDRRMESSPQLELFDRRRQK